jgi:CRP/FNR family transcriptional regulator, cyclic AMP receptor protein
LAKECVVKRARKPVFDPNQFLTEAGVGRTISKYQKDQAVFSQGEAADAVFHIQEGKIKISVVSKQGKEAVVAVLGTGDFFGEGCLARQTVRMATATAMMECDIMRLEKAAIIRVLHAESAFSEMFKHPFAHSDVDIEQRPVAPSGFD